MCLTLLQPIAGRFNYEERRGWESVLTHVDVEKNCATAQNGNSQATRSLKLLTRGCLVCPRNLSRGSIRLWAAKTRAQQKCSGYFNAFSVTQSHSFQQFGKSSIRTEVVELWLYFQVAKRMVTLLIGGFQPFKRFILLTESCINHCYLNR